jgi:hypothetical protein
LTSTGTGNMYTYSGFNNPTDPGKESIRYCHNKLLL